MSFLLSFLSFLLSFSEFFFSSNIFLQLNEFFDQICQIFTKKIVSFLSPMSFFANAEIDQKSKQIGPIRALQSVWKFKLGDNCQKNMVQKVN